MDMEEIENSLEETKMLQRFGFMNMQHYKEHKELVCAGLLEFGDLFAQELSTALYRASIDDSLKILRYWNQLCEQHALLYKMYLAKQKSK